MDEVDGRPGHVALQFGHLDAPQDAPAPSLRLRHSFRLQELEPVKQGGSLLCPNLPRVNVSSLKSPGPRSIDSGENHENVPGK
jgi:hypothetical protein